MKIKKLRNRITFLAFLLIPVTCCLLIGAALTNRFEISEKVQKNYDAQQFQSLYSSANALMNDMKILSSVLINTDYCSYISSYWNLRDEKEANEAGELLNSRINQLGLSPKLVKSIYMLGSNENQRCFAKRVGDTTWRIREVPYYYDFVYTIQDRILFDFLFSDSTNPVYLKPGSLREELPDHGNLLYERAKDRLSGLADVLEGSIIISNSFTAKYNPNNSNMGVIIIIMNPGFLEEYLPEGNPRGERVTLLDRDNRVIWTNLEGAGPDSFSGLRAAEGQSDSTISEVKYSSRYKLFANGKFKLVYSVPVSRMDADTVEFLLHFAAFSLATLALSFLLVFYLSSRISKPFKKLAGMIKQQVKANALAEIAPKTITNSIFSENPMRKQIFAAFLLPLIISIAATASFTIKYNYQYAQDMLNRNAAMASSNMYQKMSNLLSSYYLDSELTPYYEIEKILKSGTSADLSKKDIETVLVTQPLNLTYFANVVLLDSSGNVKYQSIFPNNPQLLDVPATHIKDHFEPQKSDIFWEYIPSDVFNQPATAIIRKIYDIKDANNPKKKPLGYMEMFLHGNPFQSVSSGSDMDFLILKDDKSIIYSSNTDKANAYRDLAMSLSNGGPAAGTSCSGMIDNTKYLLSFGTFPQKDWKVVIFQKFNEIDTIGRQLISGTLVTACIVAALAFLLSLGLARLIAKPVDLIKNNMKEVGKGDFSDPNISSGYDEIGELIHAYNRMVKQINVLIQENLNQKTVEHELIVLKTQSELNMLQQQINPHFLYNSLEMINMQAMASNDKKISIMATALSKLFRYTTNCSNMTVPLEKEIDHARNYVTIQQLRFGDKFNCRWNIEPSIRQEKIIKFIFQPIIENSINHGLYNITSGGLLEITARREQERLYLEVRDNGTGLKPADLERVRESLRNSIVEDSKYEQDGARDKSNGIALKNVYKRLHLYYHGKADMVIEGEYMQGTKVIITIPLENIQP
jgi:sensor histidine kinase YesM